MLELLNVHITFISFHEFIVSSELILICFHLLYVCQKLSQIFIIYLIRVFNLTKNILIKKITPTTNL